MRAQQSKYLPQAYQVPCTACGADIGDPCRELTAAPLAIKKNAAKRMKAIVTDTPIRKQPHESRVNASRKP